MGDDAVPIICGGTHYFIQHFLFPPPELSLDRSGSDRADFRPTNERPRPPIPLIDPGLENLLNTFWLPEPAWPDLATRDEAESRAGPSKLRDEIEDERLLSMHRLLSAVDPKEAGRWHWRDGRKVKRGLERWWEKGLSPKTETSESDGKAGRKAR
jgi:tRNA dimethylallyltransferase